MADPVSLGLMAGGTLIKGLGALFGGRSLKNATKQAGTTLYQGANREAENALLMPETINPAIGEAYLRAQQGLSGVTNRSADTLEQRAQQANEYLNPYIQGGSQAFGTLSQMAQAPQDKFAFQFSQDDPSYQFRMAEGQKALERSAAARGILQTGGTLKALTRYGQDAASQEYQNAFDRSLNTFKTNQAGRQQQLSTLAGLAQLGYGASGASGQNLINTAQTAGGWRNNAAQQEGDWGINSANTQANIGMKYGDMARDLRLQGVQGMANSQLGVGQAGAQMWSGLGNALGGGLQMAAGMRQPQSSPMSGGNYQFPDSSYSPSGPYGGGRGGGWVQNAAWQANPYAMTASSSPANYFDYSSLGKYWTGGV